MASASSIIETAAGNRIYHDAQGRIIISACTLPAKYAKDNAEDDEVTFVLPTPPAPPAEVGTPPLSSPPSPPPAPPSPISEKKPLGTPFPKVDTKICDKEGCGRKCFYDHQRFQMPSFCCTGCEEDGNNHLHTPLCNWTDHFGAVDFVDSPWFSPGHPDKNFRYFYCTMCNKNVDGPHLVGKQHRKEAERWINNDDGAYINRWASKTTTRVCLSTRSEATKSAQQPTSRRHDDPRRDRRDTTIKEEQPEASRTAVSLRERSPIRRKAQAKRPRSEETPHTHRRSDSRRRHRHHSPQVRRREQW